MSLYTYSYSEESDAGAGAKAKAKAKTPAKAKAKAKAKARGKGKVAGEKSESTSTSTSTSASASVTSSFSWDTVLTKEQQRRFPSCCDGAERINTYLLGWCVFAVVVPVVVVVLLVTKDSYSDTTRLAMWICGAVSLCCGCSFCWWRASPVFCGGLCCGPPASPMNHPFIAQDPAERIRIRRLGVIINPKSGNKRGERTLNNVLKPIWEDEYGIDVVVYLTEYAGHAIDLAATIDTDGLDGLVIAGGDGSFHELVNGMMRRTDGSGVPIGLIPSGTGNAVGHTLSLHKKRLEDAAHRIARGEIFAMDVNRVRFRPSPGAKAVVKYSAMTICWGLVGDIGVAAELNRNNVLAKYGVAAWVGFKAKPEKVKLELSGGELDAPVEINKNLMTAFIQNTPHFGEGYYVAPAAKLDDGCMDICMLEQAHRGQLLQMFTQLPKGSHVANAKVDVLRIKRAVITPALTPGLINIDGEVIPFAGPISVTVVPAALNIFSATGSHLSPLPDPAPYTDGAKSKSKPAAKSKSKPKPKARAATASASYDYSSYTSV